MTAVSLGMPAVPPPPLAPRRNSRNDWRRAPNAVWSPRTTAVTTYVSGVKRSAARIEAVMIPASDAPNTATVRSSIAIWTRLSGTLTTTSAVRSRQKIVRDRWSAVPGVSPRGRV